MPSSRVWTPVFPSAVPMKTGVKVLATAVRRIASVSSTSEMGFSSINNSAKASSASATVSISSARFWSTSSRSSAGISSVSSTLMPFSPVLRMAFMRTRSTTPLKLSSAPMGTCRAAAFILSFFRSWSTTRHGLAPALEYAEMDWKDVRTTHRSILLINATRGTL
jgi:hypothetical protein